jgi:catechol 2,3-dioxygenase-like lactoylglutathione lyase family enzyme
VDVRKVDRRKENTVMKTTDNEMGVRIEHAFVTVRSIERSLSFYRRLLPGWVVRWEGTGSGGHRWIHFGAPGDGQPSYLSLYEDPQAPDPQVPYSAVGIQHVGFAHPDVEALIERLSREGIGPTDTVADDPKFRRAYFVDPDGNELEFVEKRT